MSKAVSMVRIGAILTLLLLEGNVWAAPAPLIPLKFLFGHPDKQMPRISPDAKWLAFVSADEKNILQIFIRPMDAKEAKQWTHFTQVGLTDYRWADDSKTLLVEYSNSKEMDTHVLAIRSGDSSPTERDITPAGCRHAHVFASHAKLGNTVLITAECTADTKNKKEETRDVYRVDLSSGKSTLEVGNPGGVIQFYVDENAQVRGAKAVLSDGSMELRIRKDNASAWQVYSKAGPGEQLDLLTFTAKGRFIYYLSSAGADTTRLLERALAPKSKDKVIYQNEQVDIYPSDVVIHPNKSTLQALSLETASREWLALDASMKGHLTNIRGLMAGDFRLVSRDRADKNWIIQMENDKKSIQYFWYRPIENKGEFLFAEQPELDGMQLAEMRPVKIPTKVGADGTSLEMIAYLTLPTDVVPQKLPMVLLVHDPFGPRDRFGFSAPAQWLANRGYAVLQVNYRGSLGFGKKFSRKPDADFYPKIAEDIVDAVNWATKRVADPKRVAIIGAAAAGQVALHAVSNFSSLFHALVLWNTPNSFGDKIKTPWLLGVGIGEKDTERMEKEWEQMFTAAEKNKLSSTWVRYSDETNTLRRIENKLDYYSRVESFLAAQLQGRTEFKTVETFKGSTAIVKNTAALAPIAPSK